MIPLFLLSVLVATVTITMNILRQPRLAYSSKQDTWKICSDEAVENRWCRPDQLDHYVFRSSYPGSSVTPSYAQIQERLFVFPIPANTSDNAPSTTTTPPPAPNPPYSVRFTPTRTGFYCFEYAILGESATPYEDLKLVFQYPYGLLPAVEYAHLPVSPLW